MFSQQHFRSSFGSTNWACAKTHDANSEDSFSGQYMYIASIPELQIMVTIVNNILTGYNSMEHWDLGWKLPFSNQSRSQALSSHGPRPREMKEPGNEVVL